MDRNSVEDCLEFFTKAVPDPDTNNLHVQLGVHFEEVREMIDEITPLDEDTAALLTAAAEANHNLAIHLKTTHEEVIRVDQANRIGMLDAMLDQMVTSIGSCHMLAMDPVGGFDEVNQSNFSKLDDDGNPIFDLNGKIAKGPNYRKADLTPFV